MRWLEYISVAEALVIRLGGLILIAIFIGKAIIHELARVYRVTAKSGGNLSIGQQLAITGVYDLLRCGLEAPQIEDLNQLSL